MLNNGIDITLNNVGIRRAVEYEQDFNDLCTLKGISIRLYLTRSFSLYLLREYILRTLIARNRPSYISCRVILTFP